MGGSPMGSPMAGGGAYMSYGTAPPMPGQGGPVTGTYCTASPTHCMDQHSAPMGSFSMPPGSPQTACIQPPMVTPTVQAQPVPNLPTWHEVDAEEVAVVEAWLELMQVNNENSNKKAP